MRSAAGIAARRLNAAASLIMAMLLIACGDPATGGGLPPPDRALLEPAIAAATPSTVKITGAACGLATAGSGVVVANHLVLTAAHVVAGATESHVLDSAGAHRAILVVFDPASDLAVLYVEDLADEPLPISDDPPKRGTVGVVLGYPHAGGIEVSPAVVLESYRAEGHDIYGWQRTVRQIMEVQARVLPGSSGGPLVDSHGMLIGMVFAQSEDDPDIGYTLTSPPIRDIVDDGLGLTQHGVTAVSTGACWTPR